MRYHYWQFLVNQEGQPINNAKINVFLAGTNTPATVYTSQFGSTIRDAAPQTSTNEAGYFEFWLGDTQETAGYPIGQKFKIRWEKENIAVGSIDWLDIFPGFEPVDETSSISQFKNKLVSNLLANKWDVHTEHDVTQEGFPVHGIQPVDIFASDNLVNKVISNELASTLINHMDGSLDHSDIQIIADGLLSGGGVLLGSVTVSLENSDITHNNISGLQGGTVNNRYHLSYDHHGNLTSGYPEFNNVILNGQPELPSHAVRKDYVDDISQGMFWQNSVISFLDLSETESLSANDGDRYISSSTYTLSGEDITWQENYIYEFEEFLGWIEIEPQKGYTLLVEDEYRHYHFNGEEWIKFWAGFAWYETNENMTMNNRSGYMVDCSENPIELLFPETPTKGYRVDILDFTSNSSTNTISLSGNGELVEGGLSYNIDIDGDYLQFIYTNPEKGWIRLSKIWNIQDLNNVNNTDPLSGDILMYDGNSWTSSVITLDDLDDVDLTGVINGQVLVYNNGDWIPAAGGGGVSKTIITTDWVAEGDFYVNTFQHDLNDNYPITICYDTDTKKQIQPYDIESIDSNNLKIYMESNSINMVIKAL